MTVITLTTGAPQYRFSWDFSVQQYQVYLVEKQLKTVSLDTYYTFPRNLTTISGVSLKIKKSTFTIDYILNNYDYTFEIEINDNKFYNLLFAINIKDKTFNVFKQSIGTISGVNNKNFEQIFKVDVDFSDWKKFSYLFTNKDYYRFVARQFINVKDLKTSSFKFDFNVNYFDRFVVNKEFKTASLTNKYDFMFDFDTNVSAWSLNFKQNFITAAFTPNSNIIIEERNG